MIHQIELRYLCGGQIRKFGERVPWNDGQLWAREMFDDADLPRDAGSLFHLNLQPVYGSGAAWYQVIFNAPPHEKSTSDDWRSMRVTLSVNAMTIGSPNTWLGWYVGAPTDIPTGLVRAAEVYGPPIGCLRPGERANAHPEVHELPAGVWMLTARRHA